MKRLVLRRREEVLRGGQPLAFFVGLLFALVVGAVLLTVSGDPVFDTYQRMWDRSFGTADTLSATINRAVPLALAGLAVSIAATMGLWNIGAEGQIMFGATAATLVGRIGADWPSPVLITAMLIGAAIGGALWALGPGLAKPRSVSARSSRHSCSTRSPFGSSCTCKPVPGKTLMVSASPRSPPSRKVRSWASSGNARTSASSWPWS